MGDPGAPLLCLRQSPVAHGPKVKVGAEGLLMSPPSPRGYLGRERAPAYPCSQHPAESLSIFPVTKGPPVLEEWPPGTWPAGGPPPGWTSPPGCLLLTTWWQNNETLNLGEARFFQTFQRPLWCKL